ncbi:MAG: DUF3526 domain-containing protein, partial [Casimicrobium sp.]
PGITPYAGGTQWLQAHRQTEPRFRPAQDATGLQRFGALSIAWVLQVLAPLVVIILGFNMFAAERENGTLRQTLSLGVTMRQLFFGKAVALAIATLALLSPALFALVFAVASDATLFEGSARAFGLLLSYSIYLGGVMAIVLGVSAFANSSRASIAWLLGLWIIGATLLPRAVADVARELHPSPSRASFATSIDGDLNAAYTATWKREFGTDKRWGPDLPLSRWGQALRLDDQAGYAVTDKHFGALWDSYAAQQRTQELSGLVAPLLALRSVSMSFAGTDFAAHRHFARAAEDHRRLMQDMISEDLVKHADVRGGGHFDYQAGHELWHRIPAFTYTPPDAAMSWVNSARALIVLALHTLATLAFAGWAIRRRGKNIA